MKKLFSILAMGLALCACVGQKDDPEPEPVDPPTPVDPTPPDPTPEPESTVFLHRVLALEFTATWCQHCPHMAEAIEDALKERPGRIVTLAVHYSDELMADESNALNSAFGVGAYPTLFMNWDKKSVTTQADVSFITSFIDKALETETCGIAAESSVADGTLTVNAKVKSVADGDYSMVLANVEDGIWVEYQEGYGENYTCNDVLRGFIDGGVSGKSLGTLAPEQEGTVTFTSPAPESGRLALIVFSGGKAVNAMYLGLNESKDYEYEKADS